MSRAAGGLPELGALLRRRDPDRFLIALLAPAVARPALLAVFAFAAELARAPLLASEPTLALVRLQWWREVVEGAPRRHEVATPLAEALAAGALDPAALLALVEAREQEVEEAGDPEAWRLRLEATDGALAALTGQVLGASPSAEPALVREGAAYGAMRALRSGDARRLPPGLEAAEARMAALLAARAWLDGAPPRLKRPARAALVPGLLARRDLRRPGAAGPRGIGDKLAALREVRLRPG